MNNYFEFEQDFVESLRCIPMIVRYKLDTCGVKLKLSHWHQFNHLIRQELVDKSCSTPEEIKNYREWLYELVIQHTDTPAKELSIELNPAWMDNTKIPDAVQSKAQETGVEIKLEQWKNLTPLQRFVLIKLSRPSHENKNFLPAIKEFQLM
ncbi:MAG: nitrate reductase maturation protein NarM [Okeania sp. SIO2C9]|uniref:nitrate reductase associated protein n=1 Tax=Okeania sp. SIO2C9 TaxID=2607791 RepID=UPI0013BECA24|nr:nitrate reductase associated protein [Okeania sp. SIO2C9]NEQ73001.1 nitrate reductase maturation protein NarM [Okeania sp. SIO2C9]